MDRKSKNAAKEGEAAVTGEEVKEEEQKEYVPAEGSWVAELEEATEELEEILNSPGGAHKRRGDALEAYLRLCRSYSMLRQWDKLEDAATKGLQVLSTYSASPSASSEAKEEGGHLATVTSRISAWEGRFKMYREQVGRERSVRSVVDEPVPRRILANFLTGEQNPDRTCVAHDLFPNSNILQYAVLVGDLPLTEAVVARGAAIDYPFPSDVGDVDVVAPGDATALVVACANLALADGDHPALVRARSSFSYAWDGQMDDSAQCAMQLVRLGANPNRKLNLVNARDSWLKRVFRLAGMDRKSALELARMAKRTELVELMEQHLRYSPEERAHAVHCRCGSRLPWMSCHATGLGQPPHYRVMPTVGRHRVPLLAETATPAYLMDTTSELAWMERISMTSFGGQVAQAVWASEGPDAVFNGEAMETCEIAALLSSSSPSTFRAMFADDGPKSHWQAWDPAVYTGCVKRIDGEPFLWKDLHWNLDKSVLLKRTELWNKALDKYCDDMDLVGEERDRVIARHKANPCAPCGRVGCDAFESEVREFPRCSRCKMIAYCGRDCQKLDWPAHRRECGSL